MGGETLIEGQGSENIEENSMTKLSTALIVPLALGCLTLFAATAAAEDLLAGIPAPANSTRLGGGSAQGGGEQASYSTSDAPGLVISGYEKSLSAAGWTVIGSGESGSGYGGGGGLQATSGDKYLTVNAGGPAGRTFVHVCVWPTKPKDDHCGD
jgi:hypothetical protein